MTSGTRVRDLEAHVAAAVTGDLPPDEEPARPARCRCTLWVDLHHIRARVDGGDHRERDLLPLSRRSSPWARCLTEPLLARRDRGVL